MGKASPGERAHACGIPAPGTGPRDGRRARWRFAHPTARRTVDDPGAPNVGWAKRAPASVPVGHLPAQVAQELPGPEAPIVLRIELSKVDLAEVPGRRVHPVLH